MNKKFYIVVMSYPSNEKGLNPSLRGIVGTNANLVSAFSEKDYMYFSTYEDAEKFTKSTRAIDYLFNHNKDILCINTDWLEIHSL